MLPTLKPAITEMVISYYHHQSLNQTLCKDVMSIIVAGVVAEMRTTIKKVFISIYFNPMLTDNAGKILKLFSVSCSK